MINDYQINLYLTNLPVIGMLATNTTCWCKLSKENDLGEWGGTFKYGDQTLANILGDRRDELIPRLLSEQGQVYAGTNPSEQLPIRIHVIRGDVFGFVADFLGMGPPPNELMDAAYKAKRMD